MHGRCQAYAELTKSTLVFGLSVSPQAMRFGTPLHVASGDDARADAVKALVRLFLHVYRRRCHRRYRRAPVPPPRRCAAVHDTQPLGVARLCSVACMHAHRARTRARAQLLAGADVDGLDIDGNTALHFAVTRNALGAGLRQIGCVWAYSTRFS